MGMGKPGVFFQNYFLFTEGILKYFIKQVISFTGAGTPVTVRENSSSRELLLTEALMQKGNHYEKYDSVIFFLFTRSHTYG
jgi:hypothetical protein